MSAAKSVPIKIKRIGLLTVVKKDKNASLVLNILVALLISSKPIKIKAKEKITFAIFFVLFFFAKTCINAPIPAKAQKNPIMLKLEKETINGARVEPKFAPISIARA